jgi:hypothetical protein
MEFLSENRRSNTLGNSVFFTWGLFGLQMKNKITGVIIIVGLCAYFLGAFYLLGKMDAQIKSVVYRQLGVSEK